MPSMKLQQPLAFVIDASYFSDGKQSKYCLFVENMSGNLPGISRPRWIPVRHLRLSRSIRFRSPHAHHQHPWQHVIIMVSVCQLIDHVCNKGVEFELNQSLCRKRMGQILVLDSQTDDKWTCLCQLRPLYVSQSGALASTIPFGTETFHTGRGTSSMSLRFCISTVPLCLFHCSPTGYASSRSLAVSLSRRKPFQTELSRRFQNS